MTGRADGRHESYVALSKVGTWYDLGLYKVDIGVVCQGQEKIEAVKAINSAKPELIYEVDCTPRNLSDSVKYCQGQLGWIASIHSQEDNDVIH